MKKAAGLFGSIVLIFIGIAALAPTTLYTLTGLYLFGALAIGNGLNIGMLGSFAALLIPTISLGCLFWLTIRHRRLSLQTIPRLVWASLLAGVLASAYVSFQLGFPSAHALHPWFMLGGGPLLLTPLVLSIIWYRGRNRNPE